MCTLSHEYICEYGRDVGHVHKRAVHHVQERGPSHRRPAVGKQMRTENNYALNGCDEAHKPEALTSSRRSKTAQIAGISLRIAHDVVDETGVALVG